MQELNTWRRSSVAGEIDEANLKAVLGRGWCQRHGFEVTREQIIEYAAATNDPVAPHRAGDIAPPLFIVVPSLATLMDLIAASVPDGLFKHTVHTRQRFEFFQPILPGARLITRGRIINYCPVGKGTEVNIQLETQNEHDTLVVVQVVTLRIRRLKIVRIIGDPLGDIVTTSNTGTLVTEVLAQINDDQSIRYAEASGDNTPIHLDHSAARAAGLQGIILHGLCTLAFATWAVVEALAAPHSHPVIKRLSAELVSPVYPGCQLATTVWRNDMVTESARFTFHSCADGTQVVRGVADFGNSHDPGPAAKRRDHMGG